VHFRFLSSLREKAVTAEAQVPGAARLPVGWRRRHSGRGRMPSNRADIPSDGRVICLAVGNSLYNRGQRTNGTCSLYLAPR
jgi:hypothetical protein